MTIQSYRPVRAVRAARAARVVRVVRVVRAARAVRVVRALNLGCLGSRLIVRRRLNQWVHVTILRNLATNAWARAGFMIIATARNARRCRNAVCSVIHPRRRRPRMNSRARSSIAQKDKSAYSTNPWPMGVLFAPAKHRPHRARRIRRVHAWRRCWVVRRASRMPTATSR